MQVFVFSVEEELRGGNGLGGVRGGVVSKSKDESLADLLTEVEIVTAVPVLDGGLNIGVDLRVVPEEVVGESLGEEAGVAEDGEELSELGKVIGDPSAVVTGGREVLEELANVHDTFADPNGAALLEVGHSVLNVGDHAVSAGHAAH